MKPEEYYRSYFGLFNLIKNYDEFVEKYDHELKNYVDIDITQDLCNNIDNYIGKYDFKYFSKFGLMTHVKFFDVPKDKLDAVF